MLHVDIPTLAEISRLAEARGEARISIYLPTTPLTQEAEADRIALKNLGDAAIEQLTEAGCDKRQIWPIEEQLEALHDDDEFWRLQARSLAVFLTPERHWTFRLPNSLQATVQVSDRFHLKPLLRAVTFPNEALVLALSQNEVRLVEVFAELPPQEVKVPGMPKDAPSAVGKATIGHRSPAGRLHGSEGEKVRLRQFARAVNGALRPLLSGRETPLVLASTRPVDDIFRSVNTYPHLVDPQITKSPDKMTDLELAEAARPLLDQFYAAQVEELRQLYAVRDSQGRATTDIAQAARAATFGAIDSLLVDIDDVVPGWVDETDGAVRFADGEDATSYGVVDEIAVRAMGNGARVLGVRKADLPEGASLAAILRYPL
ncbi:MAG: hypothetical protein H6852_15525 [Geminicoccaceae bacterium]|jgi:hypothetical protein|nr:hypothetical protein [Geminicoccaceae bacterium]MCB9969027.1 hypothetical protein [Geminicoccaceae bacterium]